MVLNEKNIWKVYSKVLKLLLTQLNFKYIQNSNIYDPIISYIFWNFNI